MCNVKATIKLNNNPAASAELEAAGGQVFNIFNVYNASKKWKKLNPKGLLLQLMRRRG